MDLFARLARAVVTLDREGVVRLAEEALAAGLPADRAITEGLAAGMREVGEKFARKEYFVPEVLVAGRTLYAGMEVLSPHVERRGESRGTAVFAVVRGDHHDIGKNIVKLMVEASGVRVVDLGKNVPAEEVVRAVGEHGAGVVGLSTLMTTTLDTMAETVALLKEATAAAVLVGGAPVTPRFAERIGADGTAADAAGAVALFGATLAGKRP